MVCLSFCEWKFLKERAAICYKCTLSVRAVTLILSTNIIKLSWIELSQGKIKQAVSQMTMSDTRVLSQVLEDDASTASLAISMW